jgi:hypothetical protein
VKVLLGGVVDKHGVRLVFKGVVGVLGWSVVDSGGEFGDGVVRFGLQHRPRKKTLDVR